MKQKDGVKVEYDTHGVKLYERHYKDGKLNMKVEFYPNGNKHWERHYKDRKFNGEYNHWHKDGRVVIGDDGTFRDHVSIHAATADGLTRIGNCVIILNKG